MIVMPAFAQGQQCEEPIVATGIFGLVASASPYMRERIDGKCAVEEKNRTEKEADKETFPIKEKPA